MSTQTFNRQMFAGERLGFEVDVSGRATTQWQASAYIAANIVVRPTDANETGFLYQNGAAGQSGPFEPNWGLQAGQLVPDGSLEWTTTAPPAASGDTIQSVSWVQISPPDGMLVISGQINDVLTASAYLGVGTKGMTYTVEAQITMVSGAIYIAQIILAVN